VEAKSKRKKKVQCFKCGDWGHAKECLGKKRASANVAASVGDSNNDINLLWSVERMIFAVAQVARMQCCRWSHWDGVA